MNIIFQILTHMGVRLPQKKFLVTLFTTMLLIPGKVNFQNLSRYSSLCAKTYARQYQQDLDFAEFNRQLIPLTVLPTAELIATIDCSYVPKSGTQTYGLDWFYDSAHQQPSRGLEISTIAVVDVPANTAYAMDCQQTPPQKELARSGAPATHDDDDDTRVDFYVTHLQATAPYFPAAVRYLAADGYYSKVKFIDAVRQLDLHQIGKLRRDANLRYLYTGAYQGRGAPRKYAGKVRFDDVKQLTYVTEVTPGVYLYTAIVHSVSWKRSIRLVYIADQRDPTAPGYALLFCTDTELDAETIYRYYKAHFQIEFIFRAAKQFTGLTDCQARSQTKLAFHFNASLTAVNIAKVDAYHSFGYAADTPFSLGTQKIVYFNQHLLDRFIVKLGLDLQSIKKHPAYAELRTYGVPGTVDIAPAPPGAA